MTCNKYIYIHKYAYTYIYNKIIIYIHNTNISMYTHTNTYTHICHMRNPSPAAGALGMTDATVATVSATVSAMYVTTFCERSPKTVGVW